MQETNLPGVNWERLEAGLLESKSCELLIDIAFCNGLTQVVDEPTRISGPTRSLVDLIFLSHQLSNYEVNVTEGLSDHKLVLLSISSAKARESRNISVRVRDSNRADDVSIIDYLEISLSLLVDRCDVEFLWQQFKTAVHHCITTFFPERTKQIAKQNTWVTREIIQLKRKIFRRQKKKKYPVDDVMPELSCTLKEKLSEAKEKYFSEVLPEFMRSSPQRFWHHPAPSKDKIDYVAVNSQVIAEPTEMANVFNSSFHSVFSDVGDDTVNAHVSSANQPSLMPDLNVTE